MSLAVEIEGLIIQYEGAKTPALDNLDLRIPRGSFYGLLGPNGAGKTTLISYLCGQLGGKAKKAFLLGQPRADLNQFKNKIGYAPQEVALYPTLSGRDNLKFFARLLRLPAQEVDRVLEWVDLVERADDPVNEYSGGMKRRLNLGVALLNHPELLILDEPTVGVDPQSRNFIFERILDLRSQNITLIYSTHYLEEIKKLCTEVGILLDGHMLESGPLEKVMGNADLESRYLELTGRGVER